ncbi:MAG: CDP-alcohol phosphatidyltransferase family protein [Alphaproteobacteria bacterium]|nr:CDP-alcohol phosphatidyltransferase family protein [Alphaproteobacteria bacterium]
MSMTHDIGVPSRLRLGTLGAVLLGAACLLVLVLAAELPAFHGLQVAVPYAVIALLLLRGLPYHAPHRRFGAANLVTLGRAVAVCLLAGLIGHPEKVTAAGWAVPLAALAILALDGLDGYIARHSGIASRYGARFDMEVDAFLTLVLALLVAQGGSVGPWIVLCGLMRYLFVGWLLVMPRFDRPLPPRFRRKAVFVAQAIGLLGALAPGMPPQLVILLAGSAVGLVAASFAADAFWLYRQAKKDQT